MAIAKEERGVYTDMEWWTKVRLEVSRGGRKKREVLRSEGIGGDVEEDTSPSGAPWVSPEGAPPLPQNRAEWPQEGMIS